MAEPGVTRSQRAFYSSSFVRQLSAGTITTRGKKTIPL